MRRPWLIVLLAFAATRLVAGYVADHPTVYGQPGSVVDPTSDVANYIVWGNQMQDFHHWPYRDFGVEYPPGALVVANAPYAVDVLTYRTEFIILCIAFDALGLVAIYRLARRTGSWWGVGAWLVLIPLLGPVAYTRLDLVVAASIAWSLERAAAGRWSASGVWLGLGIAAKLTPVLILPGLVAVAPRRWRPFAAASLVVAVFVAPFVFDLPEMYDSIAAYHLHRGVHAESIYGTFAMVWQSLFGSDIKVVGAFGAFDVQGTFADRLKVLSNVAALGVLADLTLTTLRRVRRGDGGHLCVVIAGSLVLLTAVGRVFSPQYLVWLVAPMAAGLAFAPRLLRGAALALAGSVLLSGIFYPAMYFKYFNLEGDALAVALGRNVLLLVAGVLGVRAAWRYPGSGLPAVEEHEGVEPPQAHVVVGPHG
ncbi:MAG: hypothetical protein QOI95_287 [Acidimicrobiaceae bacterium]